MENKFIVSAAPHIHTKETVSHIMCDVIIALAPAAIFGCVVFGYKAAVLLLTCMAACILSEYVFCKIMKIRKLCKPRAAKREHAVSVRC